MQLFHGFAQPVFESLDGSQQQYGRLFLYALPAPSKAEAESMMRNESAIRIANSGNKDTLLQMSVVAEEVKGDDLAIVFWAMVDGQRQEFLETAVKHLLRLGEDVEQLRATIEGAISDYEDNEGITQSWSN